MRSAWRGWSRWRGSEAWCGWTAVTVLACVLFGAGCEDFSDDPVLGEEEFALGLPSMMISDGSRVYLATTSLFPPALGTVYALDANQQVHWSNVWSSGVALMLGGDGLLYVHSSGTVSAVDPADGRRLGFDGPGLGEMAWHPWGLPMTYGAGFSVLDRFGNEIVRTFAEGVQVHRVAGARDGNLYALVTVQEGESTQDYVWKLRDSLDEVLWFITLDPSYTFASSPGGPGLAVHDDFMVWSTSNLTEARAHDGAFLWGVTSGGQQVLVDADGTTYLGGGRRVAVSPSGDILWEHIGRSELVLTADGLGMMGVLSDRFAGNQAALGRVDRRTGEFEDTVVFRAATDFLPPVVVGGRLFGTTHVIVTSRGEMTISQDAFTYVGTGSAASTGRGWAAQAGSAGRRALPVADRLPDSAGLRGLWVAQRDGAVRALQFTGQALNFGLVSGEVYAIWERSIPEAPRLVQVGTWTLEGDRLTLAPVADLAGSRGRTSLRVRAAPPGVLSVDDPVQDVTRAFARAAKLPGVEAVVDALELTWIDETGANRAEWGGVANVVAAQDGGLWVATTYDGTGYFGSRQYRPTYVRTDGPRVISRTGHMVVGRITPDGTWAQGFHLEANGGARVPYMAEELDGVRIRGPIHFGARPEEAERLISLLLRPSGEQELVVAEKVPWPEEPGAERPIDFESVRLAGVLEGDDLVFAGVRGPDVRPPRERRDRRTFVRRTDARGAERWETRLGETEEDLALLDATLHETDGAVYVVGMTWQPLEAAGQRVDAWGTGRLFLARLNLETGAVEALVGLGSSFPNRNLLPLARVRALPSGGVLLQAAPGIDLPVNFGLGTVRAAESGATYAIAGFSPDLEIRWSTRVALADPDADGVFARSRLRAEPILLRDGTVLLVGEARGTLVVGDETVGGPDRVAPVLQFSPCGDLLPPRWFRALLVASTAVEQDDGALVVGGAYISDILEPPFVIPWPGRLPTPSDPYGNSNHLLMRLQPPEVSDLPGPADCRPGEPVLPTVTVTLPGTGMGRVVSTPPGIDCPGNCSAEFPNLQEITLTAVADPGSVFSGFSAAGHSPQDCSGLGNCRIQLIADARVEARFDGGDLTWVHPLPIAVRPPGDGVQGVGDQVHVRGRATAPFSTRSGSWDPGVDGEEVLVVVSERGIERAMGLPTVAGTGTWAVGPGGHVAFVAAATEARALFPELALGNGPHLVLLSASGEPVWARPLPTAGGSTYWALSVRDDAVGVIWLAGTAVTIDELTLAAPREAFAMFDLATGEAIALHSVGEARALLRPNSQGGFTLYTPIGSLGALDAPPPFDIPPGPARPTFLIHGADGALVNVARLRESFPEPIVRVTAQSRNDGGVETVLLDENHLPRWGVIAPPEGRAGFSAGAAWVPNVPLPSTLLRGWANVRVPVVRVDGSGTVTHAWTAAPEDEAIAVRVFPQNEHEAILVLRAARLRDGAGRVLFEGNPDDHVVAGLRLIEE